MKNCSSRELKTGHKVAENICKSLSGKGLVSEYTFENSQNPIKRTHIKKWSKDLKKHSIKDNVDGKKAQKMLNIISY